MTGDRRDRVRALAERGFDEAERRWLISPHGFLAACREAVGAEDEGFFDLVAGSSLLGHLDDESLRTTGPPPSARATSLMSAGRLALWCLDGTAGRTLLTRWVEEAIRGFAPPEKGPGPDLSSWTAPVGMLDAIDPAVGDTSARASALVEVVQRCQAYPARLAVSDLIRHFLAAPDGPGASSSSTTVLILTSRHREGELVHLVVVERQGPPGISIDPIAGPFTRADAAFAGAMETAWQATRSPVLSARWVAMSERTGAAVEVIQGRSVGAGAALALRCLSSPNPPPLDRSWVVTGAVDATGALTSLLEEDRNLATYRTKLLAAGHRTVFVPRCDHPHITGLVESGGVKVSLRPVDNVTEIVDAAERHAAARRPHVTDAPAREPAAHDEGGPSHLSRRKRTSLAAGALAGIMLLLAVVAAAFEVRPFQPSASTRGSSTAPPTVPPPPATNPDRIEDDFSNRSTGWTNTPDDAFYDGEGGYRIRVKRDHIPRAEGPRPSGPVWTALAAPDAGVRVEVDATVVSPTLVAMGLFCREQPEQAGRYQGVVFPDGQWQITENRTGSSTRLARGETTLPSRNAQRIALECSTDHGGATRLRLSVGGKPIGEATDPNGFRGGALGVVALTANAPSGEVLFDNFVAAGL
jgi:hypothetical protein